MTKSQKIILLLLAAALVAVSIAASVASRQEPERVVGDFVPPAFADAVLGAPAPHEVEGLPYGTLTLSEEISVSMVSQLTADEFGAVDVWFTAPDTNRGWVNLRLQDEEGNLLGETGIVRPGEYVQSIRLGSVPKSSGIILARILTYEPDTYYSMGSASAQVMLNVK